MPGMRYQPQGGARLAVGNPLARGLSYLKSNPGSTSQATVGASVATLPLAAEGRVRGLATRFTGTGSGTVDTASGIGQSAKGTVLVLHQSTVLPPNGPYPSPGYSHVLAATSSGNTTGNGWLMMLNNGTGYLSFRMYNADNGNTTGGADGSIALSDGKPHVTIGTWDTVAGGSLATYVDGLPHATSTALTESTTIQQPMRIGRSRETSGFWGTFEGGIYLAAVWNRVLTSAEIKSISANPWQLFHSQHEEDDAAAAAGNAYTLTAASGAFSLAAAAVRLSAARRLPADPGALALAGSAAKLLAQRRLPGAAGAFVAAAASAGLLAIRRLAVATGTLAFAGRPVKLIAARRLDAGLGAFAFAAGSAQMTYLPVPGPGGPTYTLTSASGAFGLAGAAAALLVRRKMAATTGAMVFASWPAALVARRRMVAAVGGYALQGVAVQIRAARRISAQAGTFDLVGAAALLRYTSSGQRFDISKIHPSRLVIFDGSGSRVTLFDGSGSRVTRFE